MAEKKIIAVVGATGAQGGSLARAFLNDKDSPFAVRALTRDVKSDKAKALRPWVPRSYRLTSMTWRA